MPASSFAVAALVTLAATCFSLVLFGHDQQADVVMVYLLGIMLVSSRQGLGTSILSALLSVAAFDFFFVVPQYTFAVANLRHATTFVVMFVVAVVISGLAQRIRSQATAALEREQRTAALYDLTRELASAQGSPAVLAAAAHQIEKVFTASVSVFRVDVAEEMKRVYATPGLLGSSERERSVAHWVWSNRREAGLGTSTLAGGTTLYVPLNGSGGVVGVLGVLPQDQPRFRSLEQRRQLDAFAAQMALAMERATLAEETEKARREVESEQLRSSLLSSVSHDLRTPLAVITGATSTLLQGAAELSDATRQELLNTVLEEAERLNRLIRNLLDMTRLESGAVKVKKEWLPLEELVGSALNRLDARLEGRHVQVELPGDLPLVACDAVLVEQVLINLLENAANYGKGAIEIRASATDTEVVVRISDRGPGVPLGDEARIFEKFQRAGRDGHPEGVGLGLTICRAIVAVHGGRMGVESRDGGGASFHFSLPFEGSPPPLPAAGAAAPAAEEQPA